MVFRQLKQMDDSPEPGSNQRPQDDQFVIHYSLALFQLTPHANR